MTRKSFSGAAAPTTLSSPMLVGDTSFSVAAISGWPNTVTGPFVITVDRGIGTEEKILCASYAGTTVAVASGGRGYDGTTAQGHSSGATVNHTIDANTIDTHDAFVAAVGTVTPSSSAVGDAAADGSSGAPADASHQHARESFGTTTTASAPGDTTSAGALATPSRSDHKHARESFGTSATNSAPGDVESAGVATTPSRSDHLHGREALPAGRLYQAAAQTLPTGGFTLLYLGGVSYTLNGMTTHGDIGAPNDGLIVPVTGLYSVQACIQYDTPGSGSSPTNLSLGVWRNASQVSQGSQVNGVTGSGVAVNLSDYLQLTAADVIYLYGYVSGANTPLHLTGSPLNTYLTLVSQ